MAIPPSKPIKIINISEDYLLLETVEKDINGLIIHPVPDILVKINFQLSSISILWTFLTGQGDYKRAIIHH